MIPLKCKLTNTFYLQKKEKEGEVLQFEKFLDHVKSKDDNKLYKARQHTGFWDGQCNEMAKNRKDRKGEMCMEYVTL